MNDVGAVFAALFVSHQVADHWLQTSHQAACKGGAGWHARRACAAHVGTHMALCVPLLAALRLDHVTVLPMNAASGILVIGITHYWADRRFPLRKLARLMGRSEFWGLGIPREGKDDNRSLGTGAYALDQSWHIFWLFVATVIIGA